jgi:hypothetical protein
MEFRRGSCKFGVKCTEKFGGSAEASRREQCSPDLFACCKERVKKGASRLRLELRIVDTAGEA